MANADLNRDRFIVVGVKHYHNGDRDILGVEEFVDDAQYYQLVNSNIKPDINFEYNAGQAGAGALERAHQGGPSPHES